MQKTTKEILLQSPSCSLVLQRNWNDNGEALHRFVVYTSGQTNHQASLLERKGHKVSRKDVHYAFYLFQKLQAEARA